MPKSLLSFACKTSLLLSLLSFTSAVAFSSLDLSDVKKLEELQADSDRLKDALWLPKHNVLIVSKDGTKPETLIYTINFDKKAANLFNRQSFNEQAPILFNNRDFVFAFQFPHAAANNMSQLYSLSDNGQFNKFHLFPQPLRNIAATAQSNFVATIDYREDLDTFPNFPVPLPRLKLFQTHKQQKTIQRQGRSIGFVSLDNLNLNLRELLKLSAEEQVKAVGKVTALAMSPLPRTNDNPHNRAMALARSTNRSHVLHIWYFPSVKNDFDNYGGHMSKNMNRVIETIEFSPNTPGLMLTTNKDAGVIEVLNVDLIKKNFRSSQPIQIDKANGDQSAVAAKFGKDDAMVVGINNVIYLFEKDPENNYQLSDTQPVAFTKQEYFCKIELVKNQFIVVGTKGSVQFGTIKPKE